MSKSLVKVNRQRIKRHKYTLEKTKPTTQFDVKNKVRIKAIVYLSDIEYTENDYETLNNRNVIPITMTVAKSASLPASILSSYSLLGITIEIF